MPSFADKIVKLRRSIEQSYKDLEPFRRNRKRALEQFVGSNYSDYGAPERVPINMIEIAVQTYCRLMISSTPQAKVTTNSKVLRPAATEITLALNHFSKRMKILSDFKEWVQEAIFGLGVLKVGLDDEEESDLKSGSQYYASCVSLPNFFFDVNANNFKDILYAGDRYRKTMRYVMEHPEFDKSAKQHVMQASRERQGAIDSEEKGETLSTGPKDLDDSYEPMVDLQDVYLPHEGLIVTMTPEGGSEPLWVRDYEGPPRGPYHYLCYEKVPENAMPLPPVSLWMDIHLLQNSVFRKLGRQADRQKTNLLVQGKDAEDGHKITRASDGEAIAVSNPDAFREVTHGSPNQANLAFLMQLRTTFNQISGNVEMLGGIAPASDTLGQDKMLNQNAGQRVSSMQEETMLAVKEVYESLAWWLWEDPFIELPLIQRIPGTNIEVPREFNQSSKDGNFLDYNFDIVPYSLRTLTPNERIQTIDSLVSQMVIPLLPMMQEQGITFDFEAYLRMQAELRNIPEFADLIMFTAPRHPEPGPITPGKSQNSERRYVRENVSRGMSSEARDQQVAMRAASSGGESGGAKSA